MRRAWLAILGGLITALPASCIVRAAPDEAFQWRLSNGCHSQRDCAELVAIASARVRACESLAEAPCPIERAEATRAKQLAAPFRARRGPKRKPRNGGQQQAPIGGSPPPADVTTDDSQAPDDDIPAPAEPQEATAWASLDVKACSERGDTTACDRIDTFLRAHPNSPHAAEATAAVKAGREGVTRRPIETAAPSSER